MPSPCKESFSRRLPLPLAAPAAVAIKPMPSLKESTS
jgi:hypothetical protein